jgi:hypothetical protein
MKTSWQQFLVVVLLVVLTAQQSSAASLTKEQFLRQAGGTDVAAAKAMAENLTRADWYEVDSIVLLDAFHATLEARRRFAWGKKIPEDIYLRYVVPLRICDEPLQPFRRKFLEEIGPRLQSVSSLARAALEVNLYLGERVGFKPTDKRDQGPLTTLSCGFGRCEELMILAVDALRSVGIPARGVWVPSWSARDNNHVWVEVYTESGWKFMGPAEPETHLNKAWFDRAVQRAGIVMTMEGTPDKTDADAVLYGSEYRLNVTRNYMDPAKLTVQVPENWGKKDLLWLAVFNFGTLRPLAILQPERKNASLRIGGGDFVLMGVHGDGLFFQAFNSQLGREERVRLELSESAPRDFVLTYPLPAASGKKEPDLIAESRIKRAHELRRERDARRNSTKGWMDRLNREAGSYREQLLGTLKRSSGNLETLLGAVLAVPPKQRGRAVFVSSLLSDKDLREVPPKVLSRWLRRSPPGRYAENEKLKAFVLNPKIGYENTGTGLPSEYATGLLSFDSLEGLREAVAHYAPLVDAAVKKPPLPPVTVDHLLADGVSISATNAALWWTDRLRRSGIPARREPFRDWLEFYHEGKWLPLFPDRPEKLGDRDALPGVRAHYQKPATVTLQWKQGTSPPKWKSEFLFLPIQEDGIPDYLQDVPQDVRTANMATVVTLDPGRYLVTAGRRNEQGDAAVQVRIVNIVESEDRLMTLDLVPPSIH